MRDWLHGGASRRDVGGTGLRPAFGTSGFGGRAPRGLSSGTLACGSLQTTGFRGGASRRLAARSAAPEVRSPKRAEGARTRSLAAALLVAIAAATAACAPTRPTLPSGGGSPFPEFATAYDEAVKECRGARSVVAELGLSGRAGSTKLRGRVSAGLSAPSDIRLEGVAFGRPVFFLVGRGNDATLLLPRDDRVVRNAPPEAIIEALTGVALTPAELRSAVAGCGLGAAEPANGRLFSGDWAAVDAGGAATYLRKVDGRWRVTAAVRDPLTLVYADFASGLPSTLHVRTGTVADITLRVSQLEINTPIDARAFELEIPGDALPLSIEELRTAGPLGERKR